MKHSNVLNERHLANLAGCGTDYYVGLWQVDFDNDSRVMIPFQQLLSAGLNWSIDNEQCIELWEKIPEKHKTTNDDGSYSNGCMIDSVATAIIATKFLKNDIFYQWWVNDLDALFIKAEKQLLPTRKALDEWYDLNGAIAYLGIDPETVYGNTIHGTWRERYRIISYLTEELKKYVTVIPYNRGKMGSTRISTGYLFKMDNSAFEHLKRIIEIPSPNKPTSKQ